MPNRKYLKGYELERKLMAKFSAQSDTLLVVRSGQSRGAADLIVIKKDKIILVQAKNSVNPKAGKELKELAKIQRDATYPIKCYLNETEYIPPQKRYYVDRKVYRQRKQNATFDRLEREQRRLKAERSKKQTKLV